MKLIFAIINTVKIIREVSEFTPDYREGNVVYSENFYKELFTKSQPTFNEADQKMLVRLLPAKV